MFRYELKIADQLIARKELDEDTENPWARNFARAGKNGFLGCFDAFDAVLDEQGNEIEPAIEKNYSIVKEDISAELASKEQAEQKLDAAKNDLKQVKQLVQDAKNADTQNKRDKVMKDMAKAILQLAKAQGLADPNDEESIV